MPSKDCPNCSSRVDMTKDGLYGHCASCNNILDFSGEQQENKQGVGSISKGEGGKAKKDEPDDEGSK